MAKLKDFTPDDNNANAGTARGSQIVNKSIAGGGMGRSLLADKNRKLMAGSKTHEEASKILGGDSEVIEVHTTGDQVVIVVRDDLDLDDPAPDNPARALAYNDNLANYYGFTLDPKAMARDLKNGFDFSTLPLQTIELEALAGGPLASLLDQGEAETSPPETTETEAEKIHKEWEAKPGDIWQLGQHLIACLDSLDPENLARLLPSPPGLVFSDPPYGLSVVRKSDGSVAGAGPRAMNHKTRRGQVGNYPKVRRHKKTGKTLKRGEYYPVIGDDSTETARASAALLLELYPKAAHVYWGGNHYADSLPPSPAWIVWDKDNGTNSFADCEMAWTNQTTAARIFKHRWNGMLKGSEHGQRRVHPTQKPVALAEWCMEKHWGKDSGPCLDPFLGSGITIMAGERAGRPVVGFELEPVYISVILDRWVKETGGKPQRLESV